MRTESDNGLKVPRARRTVSSLQMVSIIQLSNLLVSFCICRGREVDESQKHG